MEELQVGVLGERDRDSLVLALEHGWQYVALGVCDEDCGDLDFHLFDPAGKEIAFDTKASEHAVVWTIPPADGTYRLEVVVRSCSTPPCYYAVQLLRGMPPPTPPAAPR